MFSCDLKLRMETRSRAQTLSGLIFDYFARGKALTWVEIAPILSSHEIVKLNATDKLPEEVLNQLFKNNKEIIRKIPLFNVNHHYLIILMLKDEYSLDCCPDCGYISRKVSINMDEEFNSNRSDWA